MRVLCFLLLSMSLPSLSAAAPSTGTLVVTGVPAGQAVAVDGAVIGETPLPGPWTLPAGQHTVKIGQTERTITVKPGAPVRWGAAARSAPVRKAVTAAPVERAPLKTIGYVGAGVGAAALGAGLFFGLQSGDDVSEDERNAVFASMGYGVGAVLLAGGAALIFWGDDDGSSVGVAPAPGGAVIGGRF
jgi:hypothetical protein